MFCNHDYIVEEIEMGRDLRAYYYVKCSKCGKTKEGYADETPKSRFK